MKESRTSAVGRPKSLAKREQILDSAGEMFLLHGYERTSMDAVAKDSGVSKQTVYSHFKNKDALYNAVIESKCISYQLEESSLCNEDVALVDLLAGFANQFIRLLSDEEVIAMYNSVIGEAQNVPHVAKLFYDAGPVHSTELVQRLLQTHPSAGMSAEKAHEAAIDFFNLLKGDYHMRSLLHLPYELDDRSIAHIAKRTAQKIVLIIEHDLKQS